MKVRVIKSNDIGFHDVQIKRWYWPFWITISWATSMDAAIEKAKRVADPSTAVVWSSDATS